MRNILLVEEQFGGIKSHHFAYQSAIGRGARELGIDLDLLVNRRAERGDLSQYGALGIKMRPVLSTMAALSVNGEEGVSNRVIRIAVLFRNVFANVLAIKRELDQGPAYDLVLCPTAWLPHIAVFILLRLIEGRKMAGLALLFVQYPKLEGRPSLIFRLIKCSIDLLCALNPSTQIFAETRYAQESWGKLLGRPVDYVVHPVELAITPRTDESKLVPCSAALLPFTSYSLHVTTPEAHSLESTNAAKPVIFGFYGFARHEQGVDVLMRALEILKDKGELEAEFRIVWPNPFQMPDGSWMASKMFGHLGPNVRFIESTLGPEEYSRALDATDWLILPYRAGSYMGRCSRISIEACVLGIPVVYTQGTNLGEVVGEHGAGISIPDEDPEQLAQAIGLAIRKNSHFKEIALAKRGSAASNFSGRQFLGQVLVKQTSGAVN